ncbi:myosin-2 heavy chain, non muscle-like [Ptychodera flava]|uniref:myosin-2 heavy chain, non muscle-like n=1 Tax=Ptychodera flava TaxID=63121 RepID=UPI003969DA0C
MLLNFLSILGLYRFKSSVQTGRFAELYEPWLITDEMREIAAKVNLPLKLQVTYDEKKFRELDAFFIKRDGSISDSLGNVDGHNGCRFVKQPQSSLLVEQQSFNKANADTEETIPLARRLILFKHDRVLQSQRMTALCLLQILNIGNSADIKHITCDVIQVPLDISERIRRILLSKQEILSLLGIRAFLVTDTEDEEMTTGALAAQLEIHGTTVSAITTTHRSLLVRGLLLFDISQPKVGSYCDLCFLDLEETGRQRDRQTLVLKDQLHKEREGKSSMEEQHKKTLKELDRAIKEVKHLKDDLDNTLKERNEVEKQKEKAKQEADVFKARLDQVKEGKSLLDKQNQDRLEELDKAEKIATDKAMEIISLKKEIHDLETKLSESSDLVTKMQAQLSDAENRVIESDTIKDEFEKAQKENAHLKHQLDKAMEVVKQLDDQSDQSVPAVVEKTQIQEELDRERKEKSLPRAAGKETDDLEKKEVKEKSDSGSVFSKLRKFVAGTSGKYNLLLLFTS